MSGTVIFMFGRVGQRRTALGWSVMDLARMAGVATAHVHELEDGGEVPSSARTAILITLDHEERHVLQAAADIMRVREGK